MIYKYFFIDSDNCIEEFFETKEELEKYIQKDLQESEVGDIVPDNYQTMFYGEITHRAVFVPTKKVDIEEHGYTREGELKYLPLNEAVKQLEENKLNGLDEYSN